MLQDRIFIVKKCSPDRRIHLTSEARTFQKHTLHLRLLLLLVSLSSILSGRRIGAKRMRVIPLMNCGLEGFCRIPPQQDQ